jgi:hypothetical protein
MTYDPKEWFLAEDTEEARAHRQFLNINRKGEPLAPPTPRRKPTQNTGDYISKKQLDKILSDLDKALSRTLAPLFKKVKTLEATVDVLVRANAELNQRALSDGGVWSAGRKFRRGALTTFGGGLWISRVDNNVANRPGATESTPFWRLASKTHGKK